MMLKYAIALAIVLLLAAFLAGAFLPARHLPGNRARHLRIRLHLRLHPGKGFAHVFSLWLRWGRLAGSDQHNGHLARHHLDFRSHGGYILAPPSQIGGQPYRLIKTLGGHGGLDWDAVIRLLEPQRQPPPHPCPAPAQDVSHLARWVASQAKGNRNAGLFWAANRALDADPAADLNPLATAARHAGLDEPEITRTLDSARRTGQPRPHPSGHQAETES
jgi:Bifunctional DNA primase/polymerase, N-terminal